MSMAKMVAEKRHLRARQVQLLRSRGMQTVAEVANDLDRSKAWVRAHVVAGRCGACYETRQWWITSAGQNELRLLDANSARAKRYAAACRRD